MVPPGALPAQRRRRVADRPSRGDGHLRRNLALWEGTSDEYDRRHRTALGGKRSMAWGLWRIPESSLRALGDPRGREMIELGCGAARWSLALARAGARPVAIDVSPAQLAHARRILRRSKENVPLVRCDAERLPFRASSFDVAFCDWGALTFCDPHRAVPEAARVLRPGGRLVFSTSSPLRTLAQHRRTDRLGARLLYDYFDLDRVEYREGEVNFQLPYGEWIRLFAENGLVVDGLIETRPPRGARSSYLTRAEEQWARRWPLEAIWRLRKTETPQRKSRSQRVPGRPISRARTTRGEVRSNGTPTGSGPRSRG